MGERKEANRQEMNGGRRERRGAIKNRQETNKAGKRKRRTREKGNRE